MCENWQRRNKLSLFKDDRIVYIRINKNNNQKLLKIKSIYHKILLINDTFNSNSRPTITNQNMELIKQYHLY